jgi:acyl-CoA thioester hydrolase
MNDSTFSVDFDVRWSDLDANRHMANSAYQNFMSHARIAYLISHGFGQPEMQKYNVGPVIFSEHVHYFREIHQGKPITVTCEVTGLSEDHTFFSFRHNFYDHKGRNLARGFMRGAWMNLKERKITSLQKELSQLIEDFPKSADFKWLSKADMRADKEFPVNLD